MVLLGETAGQATQWAGMQGATAVREAKGQMVLMVGRAVKEATAATRTAEGYM